jgi:hypothetical protein
MIKISISAPVNNLAQKAESKTIRLVFVKHAVTDNYELLKIIVILT